MVRYAYINNLILKFYSSLSEIKFPLDLFKIIELIPNCRYITYQHFAELNNCSVEEVIQICESKSGSTHYDIATNRYLILCNASFLDNNNCGRQRWTLGHEIGHIVCNHHVISAYNKITSNGFSEITNPEYETEADYFAATLLAPLPLFKILNIKSPSDIKSVFGLSYEASKYRYRRYIRWQRSHYKQSWENDLIRIFKQNGSPPCTIS